MNLTLATIAVAVCVGSALACFCHLVVSKLGKCWSNTSQHDAKLYGDEDGEALGKDSSKQHAVTWARILALLLAGSITVIAFMTCVQRRLDVRSGTIYVGWISTDIATLVFAFEQGIGRYTTGITVSLSSFAVTSALVIDMFSSPALDRGHYEALCWVQIAAGLCLSWVAIWIPRRPTVYFEDAAVDAYQTCSVSDRYSFAWIRTFLHKARNSERIEQTDLPVLSFQSRTRVLTDRFPVAHEPYGPSNPLWKAIFRAHWKLYAWLWCICLTESITMNLPSICLYKILRILEVRTADQAGQLPYYSELRLWIFCLAVTKFANVLLDTQMIWHAFSTAIKVRTGLSSLVYAKALRMKLIAGSIRSGSKKTSAEEASPPAETDPLLPSSDAESTKEENQVKDAEDAEEEKKAAREVVSLLGMDMDRIYAFAGWNVDLVRGIFKLITGIAFLVFLLGWWSTLAGLVIPVLLHPLNQIITAWYTRALQEVSSARDQNTYVVTEALQGIRQIKLSATEPQWISAILASRRKVLDAQWNRYLGDIFLCASWISVPILMAATSLTVYALLYRTMTASIAFTVLAVLSSLEWTIGEIPMTITEMIDALVSCKRLEEYFNSDERQTMLTGGSRIKFESATVAWPAADDTDRFTLSNLNLEFPPNELSVIHGKTGVGKSLLLAAILGEADVLAGKVQVPVPPSVDAYNVDRVNLDEWIIPNARAYVAQVPWIENASVKNTILFGLPYHRSRYDETVKACALDIDIESFPDGDDTEIGETGINLSGGQRWRLTLARALYSRAGILIMDDIFSAVDAHVGRHLLQHAIVGKLAAGRTRILVTHHLGLVAESASYFVDLDRRKAMSSGEAFEEHRASLAGGAIIERDSKTDSSFIEEESGTVIEKAKPRKYVQDEARAKGRVGARVYRAYLAASGGYAPWLAACLVFIIVSVLTVSRSYWLVLWISSYQVPDYGDVNASAPLTQRSLGFYLGLYLALSLSSLVLGGVKFAIIFVTAFRATKHLFEKMTHRVLHTKMRWLDTEPTGRILNRFVADFTTIDHGLGMDINFTVDGTFSMLTIIAAALLVSLWMLIPMVLLVCASFYIVSWYLDGARDIKRIDAISRSPILELVSSSLAGLATLRGFGRADIYLDRMYALLDRYARATHHSLLASSWVRFRQGAVGVLLTLAVAAVATSFPESIDSALAGFALSFALNFSAITDSTLIRYTSLELEMNSTERVVEYINLPPEEEDDEGEEREVDKSEHSTSSPSPSWPSRGSIQFENLSVAYAADLPPILKNVSFTIPAKSRVGIVGRTGSGKTSLTLALFRMLERPSSGRILVDGVDIAGLRLAKLRRKLAIIPQEPVLFSGTIKSNLDPEGTHTDSELVEALRKVHFFSSSDSSSTSSAIPTTSSPSSGATSENLSHPVSRAGANLSQGQKQLLCLARAILTQPKVLILDEATSAVDMATDQAIRRSLKEDFPETTMLVVAHRLSTVVDMDRILVMRGGEVVEFDEPGKLARKEGGLFRGLLEGSGEGGVVGELLRG